ncbi:MAG: hypothetical protein DMF62_14455 [Acidobacteria bacterium]|nr:MAG: hypothetical protein DMF62_14455 [Acidobacteriota bacterium]
MLDENLIATLEQSLRQTRNAQNRLMARLREVEYESERLREEIDALENSAAQTESAIDSLLVTMRSSGRRLQTNAASTAPRTDLGSPVRESSPERREPIIRNSQYDDRRNSGSVSYFAPNRGVPVRTNNIEAISHRFSDRTITQACTLLLREAGKPLHVNELYNLLVSGGMQFKGNNPTISIAVSLNRNRRFRKVEPGTFDLIMRDASKVAS